MLRGSATALGHGTFAQGRSSFSANKFTSATNQASAALGLATTADNFGMLAVGVNNAAGIGDTTVDPNDYITIMQTDSTLARIQELRLSLETETLILQMVEQGIIHPMHLL